MPGISLEYGNSSETGDFESSLSNLLYFDRYSRRVLYDGDMMTIGATDYESYPVAEFETESHFIVLEGHLYASETTRDAITTVADAIVRDNKKEVRRWLANRDGEFLVIVVEKQSDKVYILNDALGRLPYYVLERGDDVLASRELGFILETADVEIDSMGIAQMLLFGYPLGDRTLYEGIKQIEPGSLVTLDHSTTTVDNVYRPCLDEKPNRERSIEENADRLATLFSRACRNRSNLGGTNVISLSGGLDSRAIAACFSANDLPFVASTFDRADGRHSEDVVVAEKVIDVLGVEWQQFDLPPNTGKRMSELLRMKRGMNFLAMGHIHPFFENIIDEFGYDVQYFAGDGGDKIFPPLTQKRFSDSEDVAGHLLTSQNRFDVATVEELTGYSRSDLKTAVLERIRSYPGDDPTNKYAQFLFWERGGKWVLHGEDRNRYFFWTPAPFYSLPLVEYAMGVPDKQKKRNKLYRAMLQKFSPDIVQVEYANVGASIDSAEYKVKQIAFDLISRSPSIRDFVVDTLRGERNKKYDGNLAVVLHSQSENWDENENVLSTQTIREVSKNRERYRQSSVYNLLTVTTAIELLRYGETILDEEQETQFQ